MFEFLATVSAFPRCSRAGDLARVRTKLTRFAVYTGHSWSPTFGRNGDILISALNVELATRIPNITSLGLEQGPPTELNAISFAPSQPTNGNTKLVRVGCSTTNEQLREWCIRDKLVTLPLNVIMVEITLGGSNGPIW